MLQMICWHSRRYSTNIVVYPENVRALLEVQKKLLWLFPDAKPMDQYRFPAMVCQKVSAEPDETEAPDASSEVRGCACFQAAGLIVQENYILVQFRAAAADAESGLHALQRRFHVQKPGILIMPLVWLPSGCLFPDAVLEKIEEILGNIPLEITVDLQKVDWLSVAEWKKQWENAFGRHRAVTLEMLYPDAEYEMIGNDADCPYTMPYFYVPQGYLYSTSSNPMVMYSEGKDSVLVPPYGELKMIDPNSNPPKGCCYYWYSSSDSD